jgi:hypothetical protein
MYCQRSASLCPPTCPSGRSLKVLVERLPWTLLVHVVYSCMLTVITQTSTFYVVQWRFWLVPAHGGETTRSNRWRTHCHPIPRSMCQSFSFAHLLTLRTHVAVGPLHCEHSCRKVELSAKLPWFHLLNKVSSIHLPVYYHPFPSRHHSYSSYSL